MLFRLASLRIQFDELRGREGFFILIGEQIVVPGKELARHRIRVPGMFNSLEVQVLYPARWRRRISEAQGRRREAGSEGSVEQTCDPMNKNRIRGLPGRTSERIIAKSAPSMRRGGRFGGCAGKAVELTLGGLYSVRRSRTERVARRVIAVQESAEGKVVGTSDEGPNNGQGQ